MADVIIYQPRPVCIPELASVRREFPRYSELSDEHKKSLDSLTVFYDVFFDETENCVVGLGPELLNLRKDLWPLTIRISGQAVKYRIQSIKELVFLHTESIGAVLPDRFDVVFEFASFFVAVPLESNDSIPALISRQDRRLTLTTLQKDNPIPWISDWVTWYSRVHGVTRLVFYDNQSQSRKEVIEFLMQLRLNLEIVFVDWPFLYGGFKPYFYCQIGSLNHCRMRFAVADGYCLNFDVDEYLMLAKGNLLEHLDKTLHSPTPGCLAVSQFMVPSDPAVMRSSEVRCWDFKYRERRPGYQGLSKIWNPYGRTKYIYSFGNVGYNTVHTTDSEKNDEFRKRYPIQLMMLFKVKKVIWELTKKVFKFKYPKPRIDTVYGKVTDIWFLHFVGLSTGWKPAEYTAATPSENDDWVAESTIAEIHAAVAGPSFNGDGSGKSAAGE